MIMLRVDSSRFYTAYQQYVQQDMKKKVEWTTDQYGSIHMYVFTDYGYGYYYTTPVSDIPPLLKAFLTNEGKIFELFEL